MMYQRDLKTQTNLMKSIDRLTNQVADLTTQNKTLQQKVNVAERTLRPMAVERKRSSSAGLLPKGRKNSLTFGSHAGAKVSVIYHTFIETCKMCGVSTLDYFKEFFKAIMRGRTDYENMLPMTIGIKK